MLLSSSQGLLAEWNWETGEQDLVDSDEDEDNGEDEELGLNLKRSRAVGSGMRFGSRL